MFQKIILLYLVLFIEANDSAAVLFEHTNVKQGMEPKTGESTIIQQSHDSRFINAKTG